MLITKDELIPLWVKTRHQAPIEVQLVL